MADGWPRGSYIGRSQSFTYRRRAEAAEPYEGHGEVIIKHMDHTFILISIGL